MGRVKIGKHAFVGNSGMTAPGRKVPKQGLVAVLSAAPRRKQGQGGTSWLGSPPAQLRRDAGTGDDSRTYNPSGRLRVARASVEVLRLLPVIVLFASSGSASWYVLERARPTAPAGGRPPCRRAW